jgi:hypothetical protein
MANLQWQNVQNTLSMIKYKRWFGRAAPGATEDMSDEQPDAQDAEDTKVSATRRRHPQRKTARPRQTENLWRKS